MVTLMDKAELIAFLKEALSIEITQTQSGGFDSACHTEITISLEGEEICTDWIDLDIGRH